MTPAVTVSLVTYNGMRWLPSCLASIRAQTLGDFELLVIDNASTDGSLEWLHEEAAKDQRIRLQASPANLGFARAHNRSIARAKGDFVCLLNQDLELDHDFLAEAIQPFGLDPHVAAVQARLRHLGPDGTRTKKLDSTGLVMHRDRRAVSRGQGEEDGPMHAVAGPVWGADGPAPVYRRAALLDARVPRRSGGWEVLDEDFFMYKEDVDLAWRLRLLGWTAWYTPSALAWHARGAGGDGATSLLGIARTNRRIPRSVKALSWRNQRLMQVKNERATDLLRDLPWIARREVLSFGFMLMADPKRLVALRALVAALPRATEKRHHVHRLRLREGPRSMGAPPREGTGVLQG